MTSDAGRCAALAKTTKTTAELIDELYLLAYSRYPTDTERTTAAKRFDKAGGGLGEPAGVPPTKSATRRSATEDLMWALINTPEFVFND